MDHQVVDPEDQVVDQVEANHPEEIQDLDVSDQLVGPKEDPQGVGPMKAVLPRKENFQAD